ncbi:AAA family ATPase [Succinivibrio dextrinosolvens]|uniref:AAA family ATPase n=1 Tax=Succinivibrio dextrinosolvens TaxID=83771 RepID=UPI00241FE252|nr:AAA family ATPase [Succinivibrio dextrinosolvens]MBE6422899.1 hypothetical protein [Succinivibrio dextrinosolvens]
MNNLEKKILSSVNGWVTSAEMPENPKENDGWLVVSPLSGEVECSRIYLPLKTIISLRGYPLRQIDFIPEKCLWFTIGFTNKTDYRDYIPTLDMEFIPKGMHLNALVDVLNRRTTPGYGKGYYGFGEAGVGKTSTAHWLFALTQTAVIHFNCKPNMEVEELFVSHTAVNGVWGTVDGAIITALKRNYPLIIDEMDLAPSEFVPALNNLIEGRKFTVPYYQGALQAGTQFKVIGFGNTGSCGEEIGNYNGRNAIDASSLDRMIKDYYEPLTTNEFLKVINRYSGIDPIEGIKKGLAKFCCEVNSSCRNGEFPEMISPRGLISVCENIISNCWMQAPILYSLGLTLSSALESNEAREKLLQLVSAYICEDSARVNELTKLWDSRYKPMKKSAANTDKEADNETVTA